MYRIAKRAIKESGLKQSDVAKEMGITYTTLNRKLNGYVPITLDEAVWLKLAIGSTKPLEELFAEG